MAVCQRSGRGEDGDAKALQSGDASGVFVSCSNLSSAGMPGCGWNVEVKRSSARCLVYCFVML